MFFKLPGWTKCLALSSVPSVGPFLNPNTLAGPIWWPSQGLNRILPAILGGNPRSFSICLARPLEENPSCLSKEGVD